MVTGTPPVPPVCGFSRAMHANWLWHRPLGLLVDAGEGVQLALASGVFAPSVVALTHGHSDHVLGLPGFIAARRFGKGAVEKPYVVLYPEASRGVGHVRSLIASMWRDVPFPVTWVPMAAGAEHAIDRHRAVQAFTVTHVDGEASLGYRVVETRRRLKIEHAHLTQEDIERLARDGRRDELLETYRHPVFVHSGDAMPIEPGEASGADLLVHDATFLDAADRREPIHATTEEALEVARRAGVRALVLCHLSIRYDRADAPARLRAQVAASGFTGTCYLLDEGRLVALAT